MNHEEVIEIAARWLEREHLPPKKIDKKDFFPDILVYADHSTIDKMVHHRYLQVECKKSNDDIDQALGQCLRYYTYFNGLFTYLAIPEDFPKDKLQDLQAILEFVSLPIGLLIIHPDGRVDPIRPAEGKETDWEYFLI